MILTDEAFSRLVAEDVKNKANTQQQTYLRSTDVAPRWREGLMALLKDVDGQIAAVNAAEKKEVDRYKNSGFSKAEVKRITFELEENYESKRSKIMRFRFYIEQRLAEADRVILLAETNGDAGLKPEDFLLKAIETHRDLMEEYDLEPTTIDEALWATVNGRWMFSDISETDFE